MSLFFPSYKARGQARQLRVNQAGPKTKLNKIILAIAKEVVSKPLCSPFTKHIARATMSLLQQVSLSDLNMEAQADLSS